MTATGNTDCEQAELVAEYALRALPAADVSGFERHVRVCAVCRRELERLQLVVDAFVDWPTGELRPPAPLWERLARRIGTAAADQPRPEARWTDEPAWKEVAPGISCKLLATDTVSGVVSMVVRLAPGVAYPPHRHAAVEELHLLDGELWIEGRKLVAGDYNRAEPGTADHRVWSATGCTCVLITSAHDELR